MMAFLRLVDDDDDYYGRRRRRLLGTGSWVEFLGIGIGLRIGSSIGLQGMYE